MPFGSACVDLLVKNVLDRISWISGEPHSLLVNLKQYITPEKASGKEFRQNLLKLIIRRKGEQPVLYWQRKEKCEKYIMDLQISARKMTSPAVLD